MPKMSKNSFPKWKPKISKNWFLKWRMGSGVIWNTNIFLKKKLFHEIQVLESPRQASRQIDRWTDRQGDKKIKGQDTDRQICCRRWWYYDVIPVWPSSEEEAVKVFLEGGVPLTCHLLSFPRVEGWECWRQLRRMLRCFSCGLVKFLYIHSYRFTGLTLYMLIEVSQRGEMVLNPRFQFSLWVSQMPWEYI